MIPKLKVLFLATYFPKPANPLMGTWALSQAHALLRQGMDVRVVSPTSWLPRFVGNVRPGAKAYIQCPPTHNWGDLRVDYPRWLAYQAGPIRQIWHRNPQPLNEIGWITIKHQLNRIVAEHRPDLIYAHHAVTNGFLAKKLHRQHGIPYVITDHDFGEVNDCEKYPLRRQLFERVVNRASKWVAVSSRMEADMKRLFPRAQTRTIHNGVDPLPSFIQSPDVPTDKSRSVIFSAGMLYKRKGFPVLIEAFARVAQKHPQATLRIAGDGTERAAIENTIRLLHMEERVQLLGLQPHERVLEEMVACDIFALVGWDEPWGVVFAEAMAAGKPVVCANDGGINDVLKSAVHGYTVPPQDVAATAQALDRLLSSPTERTRMGQTGKELFESQLTWDTNAETMKNIFKAAIT